MPVMQWFYSVFIVLAVLVESAVGLADEADWTRNIISLADRSFDFKTVAKGAAPEHQFVLYNPFSDPLRIKSVSSSCTCTTTDFDEETILKTYGSLVITAKFRGDLFEGHKNATLTVVIAQAHDVEIQLNVQGEIRGDLQITPNSEFIDFGNVEIEKGASRTLTVIYTGNNMQWRLVDTQCENKLIRAEITPEAPQPGKREFKVKVSLDKSAPHGKINTHLILRSNDAVAARQEIRIPIRANVGTVLTVSPASLFLGVLQPGVASSAQTVVVHGTKPFRIMKIECNNPAVVIQPVIGADDPPKAFFSLSITYKNPLDGAGAPKEGSMQALVRITTDMPGLSPTFYVTMSLPKKEND